MKKIFLSIISIAVAIIITGSCSRADIFEGAALPNPPVVDVLVCTNNTSPTWTWISGGGGGIGQYRFLLDNSDLSAQPGVSVTSFTPADPLSDGAHTLYVQEENMNGVWSAIGSKITSIDTTGPTIQISINEGVANTISQDVDLSLNVNDSGCAAYPYYVCISNSDTLTGNWEAFNSFKNWTLTSGEGNKKINIWVEDSLKNRSGPFSASIWLGAIKAIDIAAGVNLTAAALNNGTVVTWGGSSANFIPADLSGVMAVASGGQNHTVALKTDGTVVAWGMNNNWGQCTVPAGLSGVTAIAAGGLHSVALKNDGSVVAWGDNAYGQCSIPAGLSGVTAIAAGSAHTVALKSNGTVVIWGLNNNGQCTVPAGLSGVTAIASWSSHTVALKNNGTVVAWGLNDNGQCTVPSGLSGVTAIAAGGFYTVALKNDGTVVAWGLNQYGQCTVPTGLSGVKAIAAGWAHTVAIKSDGTVIAWGYNESGQCNVPADLSGK